MQGQALRDAQENACLLSVLCRAVCHCDIVLRATSCKAAMISGLSNIVNAQCPARDFTEVSQSMLCYVVFEYSLLCGHVLPTAAIAWQRVEWNL